MNRFMIAGTSSSCGKTTVTCAVLSALKKRNLNVSAFKCGPDYIDTMFHKSVLGIPSHNLDSFFCDDDTLGYILNEYGGDVSVIEGVMGFYDGGDSSACAVSNKTDTPAVIVIDCKGMSDSIGAVMSGFLNYRKPNNISGFIFNRLPEQLIPLAKKLCSDMNTNYLGCFPKTDVTFESRHLGLVTADEIGELQEKLDILGSIAEKYIEIEKLLELHTAPSKKTISPRIIQKESAPTIAVAKDKAFCFIYDENIDLLKKFGCKIIYFSPLNDRKLPDCDGLLLYGGYPELYAKQLSENKDIKTDIKNKIDSGMPVIAECGGFMYLHDSITDMNGKSYTMCGVIKGNAYYNKKLTRFGYVTMTSLSDNVLASKNGKIKAHEFHYYESDNCGSDFIAKKKNGKTWECIHACKKLFAGFPHIYFYSDTDMAERFIDNCICYGEHNGKNQNNKTDR